MFYLSIAAQDITLTSTLTADLTADPQETVNFTCVTRGFPILDWRSEEYIGMNGEVLQFSYQRGSSPSCAMEDDGLPISDTNTVARCLSAQMEDGLIIIESELTIVASARSTSATVSCSGNGSGSSQNITFSKCGSLSYKYT